jgi:flagellar motor switch protein FliM
MLLGGTGKASANIQRKISEIEQKLLDGLFRIILHDLREAWKGVTAVEFTIDAMETEPQLLHIMAPNEAVVSIGVEVRIGESVGMMNIAMPSIVIKMMRQKFDQQWSVRKTHASEAEQSRILRILRNSLLSVEGRLEGPTLSMHDLMRLQEGHLLTFDYPVERAVQLRVNGSERFAGHIVASGRRRGFLIETVKPAPPQGRSKESDGPASGLSPPA